MENPHEPLHNRQKVNIKIDIKKSIPNLEGWDRAGGREAQEAGDVGIYVYAYG